MIEPIESRIRIVIADDEPHFRHGLRHVLESAAGHIDVVGEASSGREAVEQVRRLAPDVVILDIRMPDGDGIGAAQIIARFTPPTRILMLTVSDSSEDVKLAAKAGASGYLLKEASLEEVIEAVLSLAHGGSWPAVPD
jgi:DNA-binding NarL/FixJ family response regulator